MWIMESILIFLVVSLMSSPVLGISESMSCSMVNGQTICQKQTSQGNTAASYGGAAMGGGQSYQDVYAGAGNPGQWDSGRQTVYGNVPSGNPGNTGSSSGSFSSSSSSSSNFPGQAGGFGFATAGGYPVGGGGFAFGGFPGQGFSGGFATAGTNGGGYPVQAPESNSGPAPGTPQGFDPFVFVRPFFNGGAGAFAGGAGAYAGGFAGGFPGMPFGRR